MYTSTSWRGEQLADSNVFFDALIKKFTDALKDLLINNSG